MSNKHRFLALIAGFGLIGCASSDKGGDSGAATGTSGGWGGTTTGTSSSWGGSTVGGTTSGGTSGGSTGGTGSWTTPPTDGYEAEEEVKVEVLRPAATAEYVFIANPDRDTVSRIAKGNLSVVTAAVGVNPSVVATTPDDAYAVVFNKGSDTVSILDAGTLVTTTVEVRPDLNQMLISPSGGWAVCYRDDSITDDDTSTGGSEGVESMSEISFVNLAAGSHHPMAVGFNPSDVTFTEDDSLGLVVSDAWLAVIDLTADDPQPERIQIDEDTVDPPQAEEVVLSADGSRALIRQFEVDSMVVVDLSTQEVSRVAAGLNPTDLDITPDGESAVVVARVSHQLWIFDLSDPFAAPEIVDLPEDEVFGSLEMSDDGKRGLLYSTATGAARFGAWDRRTDEVTVHSIVKPVDRMTIAPGGDTALIFHTEEDQDDIDSDSPFRGEWALTILDMSSQFQNPLRLSAEPFEHTISDDGARAFFIMEGQPFLETIDLSTQLFDEVELRSVPEHVGAMAGTVTAYVSQDHELGRVSFYDADTEQLQTITGFELNSGIEY